MDRKKANMDDDSDRVKEESNFYARYMARRIRLKVSFWKFSFSIFLSVLLEWGDKEDGKTKIKN